MFIPDKKKKKKKKKKTGGKLALIFLVAKNFTKLKIILFLNSTGPGSGIRKKTLLDLDNENESKEKHGILDPMPEFIITQPYVDSNTCIMGNPMPKSTLSSSQGLKIWLVIH